MTLIWQVDCVPSVEAVTVAEYVPGVEYERMSDEPVSDELFVDCSDPGVSQL